MESPTLQDIVHTFGIDAHDAEVLHDRPLPTPKQLHEELATLVYLGMWEKDFAVLLKKGPGGRVVVFVNGVLSYVRCIQEKLDSLVKGVRTVTSIPVAVEQFKACRYSKPPSGLSDADAYAVYTPIGSFNKSPNSSIWFRPPPPGMTNELRVWARRCG